MVPGGAGDWLQADDKLLNPYFGSKMLRCGEKVQVLPPAAEKKPASDLHHEHRTSGQVERGE
jgi:Cu(I)/Ag(I) efflux system membrane fusion protein